MSTLPRGRASHFRTPATSLREIDAEAAATLITMAADVALVIDGEGVIEDLSFGSDMLSNDEHRDWLGRPWIDTVTAESRPKVEQLLRDAAGDGPARGREVNHQGSGGQIVPVRYAALRVGGEGRVVAVGRDLTALADLQQQLIRAQQSMEREYARLRHAETRYRLLFQISSEAVLIADAMSQKVVDANPAATELTGAANVRMIGRDVLDVFNPDDRESVRQLLTEVRFAGRADGVRARLARSGAEMVVSASLFRQEKHRPTYLLRLTPLIATTAPPPMSRHRTSVQEVVEALPDSFVVTARTAGSCPPTALSWISPRSPPSSRSGASCWTAGSAGPGST